MSPWRYSSTSLERWLATRVNPIFSNRGSSTWGAGDANSTNSKPMSPIGFSKRSAMVCPLKTNRRLAHAIWIDGITRTPSPNTATPTPGWTAVSGPMFLRAEASADARQPVPVELAAGGVTLGRSSQTRHVLVAQLAHHLGGRTQAENPVGELLALGDDGPGAHQAAPADDRAVEDHRLDADERAVADGAAVDHGLVADGDVGPDVQRVARVGMEHRALLDVAARPHGDGLVVGPDHRPGPHAGPLPQDHPADEGGLGGHEGAGRKLGRIVVESVDGHGASPRGLNEQGRTACPDFVHEGAGSSRKAAARRKIPGSGREAMQSAAIHRRRPARPRSGHRHDPVVRRAGPPRRARPGSVPHQRRAAAAPVPALRPGGDGGDAASATPRRRMAGHSGGPGGQHPAGAGDECGGVPLPRRERPGDRGMNSVHLQEIWVYLSASPLLWLALTLVIYAIAHDLQQRARGHPLVNPVLISVVLLVGLLSLTATPYQRYFDGAQFVHFLLGPATVALAIPLHGQLPRLVAVWRPIAAALLAGSATAALSAYALAGMLGASSATMLSLAPKSVTTPIAMGIAERIGGLPSLTAVLVILTGIVGAVCASGWLRLLRIRDDTATGFALGLACHGIGTARAFQISERAGAFAALAMGVNGLLTAVALPLVLPWIERMFGR